MKTTAKLNVARVSTYILLAFLTILCIVPIWILLVNATRTTTQIQSSLSLIPGSNILNNWKSIVGKGVNIGQGFINSCVIAFSSTFLSVYFSIMTAYAIKVYNFKFKNALYRIILIMVMIPPQLSIIGFYQYMAKMHLLNSYIPLILPSIASAATVFFAKQYLDSSLIPELIEAARIDGAGELKIYNRIVLPIAAPGAFTMGIFAFVAAWNNFFVPFVLISKQSKYTLPMLMSLLRGDMYRTEYGSIYLGMAITVIPIIVVYLFFSKYIVQGISMGGVKE
jgi:multiple sugar transport system permease protein